MLQGDLLPISFGEIVPVLKDPEVEIRFRAFRKMLQDLFLADYLHHGIIDLIVPACHCLAMRDLSLFAQPQEIAMSGDVFV